MKFNEFLTQQGLTPSMYESKSEEEKAVIMSNYMGFLGNSITASKDGFNELKSSFESFKSDLESKIDFEKNETFIKLKSTIEDMEETIEAFKNAGYGTGQVKSLEQQIKEFFANEENQKAIVSAHKNRGEIVEFKVVGDITTANGTNTSPPAITGTQQAPIQSINLRDSYVLPLTTNVNTSLAAYPYTEAKPKDGDYSFVAEGTAKPQMDFDWNTRYAQPVKAAAWERLTDESVKDIVGLESVARDLLFKKHNLKKQNGILFGDGVSPNPKGATVYARTFSAGNLANTVASPNIMDVINAVITDIYTTHNYTDEMSYMPSLVLMHPEDFFVNFVAAKDGDGKPLYPMAQLFGVVQIGGMTIRTERDITPGNIFVADMSKYNTTNYVAYTVKMGWINDDFIKNQFVMLGESRFHAFVKNFDEQAFVYDSISTIKTAIATI